MTRRRITIALAVVAGLLGIVHLALATLIFGIWTTDVLWFVGTGVAIVIAAAANLIAVNAPDRAGRSILVIINAMMAGFFAAAWSVLPGPQVIVGGILFAGLAVCAWTTERGHRPS
ncbi:MAG: hypothetical protein J0H88_00510 [Sphingomonadales bacterium]|jgi:MFS family permease|nr:hypothetical protein [Sphingomonadales bacterium]HEV7311894.1 hypothetical protein [Sphingopyxis sp.]